MIILVGDIGDELGASPFPESLPRPQGRAAAAAGCRARDGGAKRRARLDPSRSGAERARLLRRRARGGAWRNRVSIPRSCSARRLTLGRRRDRADCSSSSTNRNRASYFGSPRTMPRKSSRTLRSEKDSAPEARRGRDGDAFASEHPAPRIILADRQRCTTIGSTRSAARSKARRNRSAACERLSQLIAFRLADASLTMPLEPNHELRTSRADFPAARVRRFRRLRPPERRRPDLLRALRAAASRAGKRRHRHEQRPGLDLPVASRHGAGFAGLRRGRTRALERHARRSATRAIRRPARAR